MSGFTHFDASGHAVMVDVSEKQETQREATAKGKIYMSPECFALVKAGEMKKGDVLGVARIAGIMGAKKTSELIPLCHILNLSKAEITFTYLEESRAIEAACTAKTVAKTGVEMEALTGVNIMALQSMICVRRWIRQCVFPISGCAERPGARVGHLFWKARTNR